MNRRALGTRTGLTVSEIGFGGWGIGGGWGTTNDADSLEALRQAIDAGVTFVDTAWMYGEGRSERLIGEVVRSRPDAGVRVATKVPPADRLFPAPASTPVAEAYPSGHLRRYTEESLERLGLDRVDLQQLHVWAPRWLHEGDWLLEVQELKDEGLIGAFGVSVNDHQPGSALELVRSGVVDTIQIVYNVFDQSPEDELLAACRQHGVGVIVRVPLDEGGLTGAVHAGTSFEAADWRANYFRGDRAAQVGDRVAGIVEDLQIRTEDLPEVALRYVLSHPAVSVVIPGMRSLRSVRRNVAVADGRGLPAAQVAKLHTHRWVRDFYS